MGIPEVLLVVAAAQTLLASAILVAGKRTPSNLLLAGFLFLFGITFLHDLAGAFRVYVGWPMLAPLSFFFKLLAAPTLYFYVTSLTRREGEPLLRHPILHAVPVGIGVLLMSTWMLLSETERAAAYTDGLTIHGQELAFIVSAVLAALAISQIQILVYLVSSIRLLFLHLTYVSDFFSNLENKTLSWLRLILSLTTVVWITDFVVDGVEAVYGVGPIGESLFIAGELVFIYALLFGGLRQPPIYTSQPIAVTIPRDTEEADKSEQIAKTADNEKKYSRSALDDAAMARIAAKLVDAMSNDRLYANSSLTLVDLSNHVQVPRNYVSQTLNQYLNQKFYDFVAFHRIEKAKDLLNLNNSKKTILDIALEVGFNSKSTFNAAFKRHAGVTPSEYRHNNRLAP